MSRSTLLHRAIPAVAALAFGFTASAALAQTSTMAPAPTASSSTMAPASPSTMAPAKTSKKSSKSSMMAPTSGITPASSAASRAALTNAQKFTTVAAAQASCPGDTVVWSSLTKTHSFHLSTSKYYGKTKHGAYVCQQAAIAAGYHQTKT